MRRCPECNRSYEDESFNYCLEDGSKLVEEATAITLIKATNVLQIIKDGVDARNHPHYLLFCDLDGFNSINRTFGEHIGDIVLKEVEKIIRRQFHGDVVYRLEGDQFIVIMHSISEFAAITLAEQCWYKIKAFEWSSIVPDLYIDSSWGVAYLTSAQSLDEWFLRAIYGAKSAKKGAYLTLKSGKSRQIKVVRGPAELPKHFSRDIGDYLS